MTDLKIGERSITLPFVNEQVQEIRHVEPELNMSTDAFDIKLSDYFKEIELIDFNVLIVIADKTRLCEYNLYLPVLENYLKTRKVKNIQFIIAYGNHKPQNQKECIKSYGEIYDKSVFIHPDSSKTEDYINIGRTTRGTQVDVRNELFQADLVITFGAVSHHYFAGYGGGRKLIFPGLAYQKSIYQNHSLFLDKKNGTLHEKCLSGVLEDNPVAEDLREIDEMLPPRVSIYGILDSKGKVCNLEIGDIYFDFKRICKEYDKNFTFSGATQYDIVVASCGGYPKDINFIQAHKSIHNAASFVKDKGSLIIYAECIDGIGSDTFLPYFEMGYDRAFKLLADHYEGNGGTALAMMEKVQRIDIYMVTSLDQNVCEVMGVKKIDEEKAIKKMDINNKVIAVLPTAGLIIKK